MPASVNANFRKALNTYLRASAHLVDILAKEESATLAEARPRRRKVRSDWGSNLPPLNSVGTEKSDPDRASPAMSSHETVRIYVAGCDGLKALAREFSLPLFKIGTTRGDLLQRLAVLGADQYAANYRHGRKMITEPGFNRWSLTTLDFDLPKSLNSPIWINPVLCASACPVRSRRMISNALCAMRSPGFLWRPGSKLPMASGISRNSESFGTSSALHALCLWREFTRFACGRNLYLPPRGHAATVQDH